MKNVTPTAHAPSPPQAPRPAKGTRARRIRAATRQRSRAYRLEVPEPKADASPWKPAAVKSRPIQSTRACAWPVHGWSWMALAPLLLWLLWKLLEKQYPTQVTWWLVEQGR